MYFSIFFFFYLLLDIITEQKKHQANSSSSCTKSNLPQSFAAKTPPMKIKIYSVFVFAIPINSNYFSQLLHRFFISFFMCPMFLLHPLFVASSRSSLISLTKIANKKSSRIFFFWCGTKKEREKNCGDK